MGLMDLLQQYAGAKPDEGAGNAADHFHEVAQSAPPEAIGQGIAAAFHSDQTPPFAQMVSQLFSQANPQQQSGMLNQLLATLGPGAAAVLGGGNLQQNDAGVPQIAPEQASQVSSQQVQQLAEHAQRQDPGIVDKLSGFYAQHPALVKTLGGAALAIALSKIAGHMRTA
ncbi:MAG TPA: hypothetical protein VKV32_18060 [Stellaceae bacterium]|nr:hypothetical protein [Stellaceae bacterium]